MQRAFWSRGTSKKEKEPAPKTPDGDGKAEVATHAAAHQGLTAVAEKAFAAVLPFNASYGNYRVLTEAYVTKAQQRKIADIASFRQRSKKDTQKRALKDLVRAHLYRQYMDVIYWKFVAGKPLADGKKLPALAPAAQEAINQRYFPKTLQNRDKWAGLIAKGPYAPETQQWLKDAGLSAAIPVTPKAMAAAAMGPKIDVRATFIGAEVLGARRRMHLFIVYTDSDGRQMYLRGGPGGKGGTTRADIGDYTSGTVDWDPSAPSVTVLSGDEAKAKLDGLIEAASQIEGLKVPYVGINKGPAYTKGALGGLEAFVGGENCNSVAWTMLTRAGVPAKKPSGVHPGWGHHLGQLLKQGKGSLPPLEDDTGGFPALLQGGSDTAVQVYFDRNARERLMQRPGGTDVHGLMVHGEHIKVRFADGAIGWISKGDLRVPEAPERTGRMFRLTPRADDSIPFDDKDGNLIIASAGHDVEVLDPDFTVGQGGQVEVRYVDDDGTVVEGFMPAELIVERDDDGVDEDGV